MRRLAVAFAALVALAGCGVSGEPDAHRVAAEDVPFELLAPSTTERSTTTTTSPDTTTVDVYFVLGEGLAAVDRELEPPVTPGAAVEVLVEGPTEAEAADGVTTFLPDDGGVRDVVVRGGVATVEALPSFAAVPPERQRLALAQVVFTLTARPGVGRVSFTIDGQPVDVPIGDGTLTTAPVSRDDYPLVITTR